MKGHYLAGSHRIIPAPTASNESSMQKPTQTKKEETSQKTPMRNPLDRLQTAGVKESPTKPSRKLPETSVRPGRRVNLSQVLRDEGEVRHQHLNEESRREIDRVQDGGNTDRGIAVRRVGNIVGDEVVLSITNSHRNVVDKGQFRLGPSDVSIIPGQQTKELL